jgi:hypothetical protein
LKIVEEVEKNPGEKCVDLAKRLGLAPSTLNSIFAKKDGIQKQTEKCGNASKWYQQARVRIFQLMEPFFVEKRT